MDTGPFDASQQFIHPSYAIQQMDLRRGMVVADFGCGTGYFTILIAEAVGGPVRDEGRVYAIDVLEQPLESVRSKAKIEMLLNVEPIRANLEVLGSTDIPDESCDMVLMANVLFQSEQKEKIFDEAQRVVKPGGKLVVIDWFPEKALFRGMGNFVLTPDDAIKLATNKGFVQEKKIEVGSHHFGFMFKKS